MENISDAELLKELKLRLNKKELSYEDEYSLYESIMDIDGADDVVSAAVHVIKSALELVGN